jgi:hypothetical protein
MKTSTLGRLRSTAPEGFTLPSGPVHEVISTAATTHATPTVDVTGRGILRLINGYTEAGYAEGASSGTLSVIMVSFWTITLQNPPSEAPKHGLQPWTTEP